ncbi:MAG: flavodoxin family protein [Anaeroplasmataceae bacterium]|nr:flavodoxin family protein [Anaeroplasmataceae bacterium]
MKVLCINGSPHIKNGCVYRALEEMVKVFESEGVEAEIVTVGNQPIRGCIACGSCYKTGKCVFDDEVNQIAKKFEEADGLVIGSPVYYASANGTLISLLDRLFYSTHFDKRMKVGASVVSCRRGGNTATFDELNKYFTITQMPIASSQYWNMVHGFSREDVEKDLEGLQTMRTLAKNMVFLMKSIELGKKTYGLPKEEIHQFTSFMEGKND